MPGFTRRLRFFHGYFHLTQGPDVRPGGMKRRMHHLPGQAGQAMHLVQVDIGSGLERLFLDLSNQGRASIFIRGGRSLFEKSGQIRVLKKTGIAIRTATRPQPLLQGRGRLHQPWPTGDQGQVKAPLVDGLGQGGFAPGLQYHRPTQSGQIGLHHLAGGRRP